MSAMSVMCRLLVVYSQQICVLCLSSSSLLLLIFTVFSYNIFICDIEIILLNIIICSLYTIFIFYFCYKYILTISLQETFPRFVRIEGMEEWCVIWHCRFDRSLLVYHLFNRHYQSHFVLSVCLSVSQSVSQYVCLSVCQSVSQYVCLSVCLSICLV